MIEVAKISKYYSSRKAIKDVSFKIHAGEIVGLLGLNGAGKSTILKILGCYLAPSAGEARLGGYSVSEQASEVRRLIGYLPDKPPLYGEMTVKAYLAYVALLKNVARADVAGRIDYVVEKTNLSDVMGVRLDALSHGYQQRVGIAQALVHDPKVLILDEPINGLDPIQIVEMRDLILSLKGRHTVILSSHILSEITKTCDRILVIDKGELVAEGAEKDLERTFAKNMRLEVEWDGHEDQVTGAIRRLSGVVGVEMKDSSPLSKAWIDTEGDLRADVAKAVIDQGGRLYGLSKTEAGLESLFLKLLQQTNERGAEWGKSG